MQFEMDAIYFDIIKKKQKTLWLCNWFQWYVCDGERDGNRLIDRERKAWSTRGILFSFFFCRFHYRPSIIRGIDEYTFSNQSMHVECFNALYLYFDLDNDFTYIDIL